MNTRVIKGPTDLPYEKVSYSRSDIQGQGGVVTHSAVNVNKTFIRWRWTRDKNNGCPPNTYIALKHACIERQLVEIDKETYLIVGWNYAFDPSRGVHEASATMERWTATTRWSNG